MSWWVTLRMRIERVTEYAHVIREQENVVCWGIVGLKDFESFIP